MLQGDDARRTPFFGDFILKEDFDGIADPIGFNQTLGHRMASSTQTAATLKGRLNARRPFMVSVPASVWRSHHTGAWASIAYALGISALQILRQEVQHRFHVGGITELRTTVAGAFKEGQRGLV